jgi:phosphoribosylanthranilate isomerase
VSIIKVCGMTRADDAGYAVSLGADMLGFIFHPKSPRCVTPTFAASVSVLARKVGVFVKHSAEEVLRTMEEGGLDMAQLHGGQDPEFCRAVGPERVVKVLWPQRHETRSAMQAEVDRFAGSCSYMLFDAGTSGGGHGVRLDWEGLAGIRCPVPRLVAGGLGPDNAARALAESGCQGVDLNSGVESAPGIKDHQLLRRAFAVLRGEE